MNWSGYISLGISILTVLLAVFTYFHVKRQLIANTISVQRMQWITELRKVLREFIVLYYENEITADKIICKKYEIELFLNRNNDGHKPLIKELNRLIENKESDLTKFVDASQYVLNRTWRYMKAESGITMKQNKKIQKEVNKISIIS